MTQPAVQVGTLYRILVQVARNMKPITYGDLSDLYAAATRIYLQPHGTWDVPLGEVNKIVWDHDMLPAISAVVTLKPEGDELVGMPGGKFWGCCPSVPSKPRDREAQLLEWSRILNNVFGATWPDELPI